MTKFLMLCLSTRYVPGIPSFYNVLWSMIDVRFPMEKWLILLSSSVLFVGGEALLRLAREHGDDVYIVAVMVCLGTAYVLYSHTLTDDFVLGTVVSTMFCLIGYALAARIVFGEPITLIKGIGLAMAVLAATLVAWSPAPTSTSIADIPS